MYQIIWYTLTISWLIHGNFSKNWPTQLLMFTHVQLFKQKITLGKIRYLIQMWFQFNDGFLGKYWYYLHHGEQNMDSRWNSGKSILSLKISIFLPWIWKDSILVLTYCLTYVINMSGCSNKIFLQDIWPSIEEYPTYFRCQILIIYWDFTNLVPNGMLFN